jgi:hypothetical protein
MLEMQYFDPKFCFPLSRLYSAYHYIELFHRAVSEMQLCSIHFSAHSMGFLIRQFL